MVSMLTGRRGALVERARHAVPVVLTLALVVLSLAALASTYFGDARSPYDTCYGLNGRAISCTDLRALQ